MMRACFCMCSLVLFGAVDLLQLHLFADLDSCAQCRSLASGAW